MQVGGGTTNFFRHQKKDLCPLCKIFECYHNFDLSFSNVLYLFCKTTGIHHIMGLILENIQSCIMCIRHSRIK